MSLNANIVDSSNERVWGTYLSDLEKTTFVDDKRWHDLMDRHYELPHFRTIVRNGRKVEGALSLTMTNHPVFGKYLATAPFANYGGFYFSDAQAMSRLLAYAEQVMKSEGARYVVIRHIDSKADVPSGWKASSIYATYIVDLKHDPNDIFQNAIKKRARRDVNKALREGFTIQFGSAELLDAFWGVISRSMQQLGSPYHSKGYLTQLLDIWGRQALVGVTYSKDGVPAGGCLLMFHKNKAILLHANILYEFRSLCAGDYLYWSVIEECSRRGYSELDLGRSLIGSGNETFKMKWNPKVYPLQYWYFLKKGAALPNLNQSNPRYELPRRIWKRLPLWVHRAAGPHVISGIL